MIPISVAKDGGAREYAQGRASERKESQKRPSERKVLTNIHRFTKPPTVVGGFVKREEDGRVSKRGGGVAVGGGSVPTSGGRWMGFVWLSAHSVNTLIVN